MPGAEERQYEHEGEEMPMAHYGVAEGHGCEHEDEEHEQFDDDDAPPHRFYPAG